MNLSPSQINQANQTANPIDAKPASNLGSPAAGRAVDAGLFADILSRHWQHLAQNERQEVAASADATFAAVGRLPAQSAPAPVKPAQEPTQDSDRVDDAAQARSDQADAAEDAARANDRAHHAAAWRADAHTALDAGRLPQVPEHLLNLSLSSSPQAQMTNDGLLVMPLGERINIVTTPQPQVNAQSVADFARSMGMNELQIEQLFGAQATVVTASDDTLSTLDRLTANGSTGALPLANSSNATGLLMQTNATSSSPVSMTQQANPLSTLASLNALGHSTLSAPLAAQAADAAQAKPSPTLPTATSVDVLTIMEADFAPEVWQALQSRVGANGQNGQPGFNANGSAALAMPNTSAAMNLGTDAASPTPVGGLVTGAMVGQGMNRGQAQATLPSSLNANPLDPQEAYDELNQKFTSELASRIHQQINSGEWKMKFALKPASLGHLDVQLEMRDGKLSAVFQTDNAMTQDLLSTGSQRLKEALAQLGHSNASVWVGSGGAGQSQGQGQGRGPSTPPPAPHGMSASSDSSSGSNVTSVANRSAGSSQSSTHLDLFA